MSGAVEPEAQDGVKSVEVVRPDSGDAGGNGGPPAAGAGKGGRSGKGRSGPPPDDVTYMGVEHRSGSSAEHDLGDFTTTPDVLKLVPLAIAIGALGAGVALGLLDMIGLFTNLFYYQRWGGGLVSPANNSLGAISLVIPVGGGLIVGLMAKYGTDQIRGHGIPEAMEKILVDGSKVRPRVAVIKPIASAIVIGSGGPFGAEGPIILTGGAVGSIIGQMFRLTGAQRRALLVAGAAAGMSAVFGTPVAAALFGVELLVFEFKPRSMVLIGLASATADGIRMIMASHGLIAPQPLFPIPAHAPLGSEALGSGALIGIATGLFAWILTESVYGAEDFFVRLGHKLHWMWWPALGGVLIGVGGLIDSKALGVGYGTIHAELLGQVGVGAMGLLLVVKLVIWAGSLGSGTSGGILAPILMMGAAVGGMLGSHLPGASTGVFALVGMAGALAGCTRSPFTAVVFSFELTHDVNSMLAVLVASMVAFICSVLLLKRSILTEKVARRGFHVSREYAVDPLEATFVREVMQTDVYTIEPDRKLEDIYASLTEGSPERRQRLYPVIGDDGFLQGVLPWSRVLAARADERAGATAADVMIKAIAAAHPDEVLTPVAHRMAAGALGVLPVVERENPRHLVGLLNQFDLMMARQKLLEEERKAERVLTLRMVRQEQKPVRSD